MCIRDRDVSVIDQLPPGRTPISTYVIREDKRQRMYQFVRRQVGEGRQVYILSLIHIWGARTSAPCK